MMSFFGDYNVNACVIIRHCNERDPVHYCSPLFIAMQLDSFSYVYLHAREHMHDFSFFWDYNINADCVQNLQNCHFLLNWQVTCASRQLLS